MPEISSIGGEASRMIEPLAASRKRRQVFGAVLGSSSAALPLGVLWGFTVDDALITARVAANLAQGAGYRFNVGGPIVDAVTPLGFAYLLAPFALGGPLAALTAAKWLGAVSWLWAAAWLGARIAVLGSRPARFAPLAWLAVCAPLGAWAASGMETGLVTALCTFALAAGLRGLACAGLAAALRPELVPWALVLAVGQGVLEKDKRRLFAQLGLALGPALIVAVVRALAFGRPAPLAVFAKPSDLDHGLYYALNAAWHTGVIWLLAGARAHAAVSARTRVFAVAIAAHFASLIAAGGDWMALYRLAVPVLPSAIWVAAELFERSSRLANALRLVPALACALWLFHTPGLAARSVGRDRQALIDAARPVLAGAESVLALDIGWLGAATSADIVDLAGLTDPAIAFLPGGHTSKQVPASLLSARDVDAIVLLLAPGGRREPWWESQFALAVGARVAAFDDAREFSVVAELPLGGTGQSYLVLRTPSRR